MTADMRKHASFRKGKHACNSPGDPRTCDNCGEHCIITHERKLSEQNVAQSLKNETELSVGISVSWCRWAARIKGWTGLQRRTAWRSHAWCDLWAELKWRREPVSEGWVNDGGGWFFDGSWRQSTSVGSATVLSAADSERNVWECSHCSLWEQTEAASNLCIWKGQSCLTLPSACNRTRTSSFMVQLYEYQSLNQAARLTYIQTAGQCLFTHNRAESAFCESKSVSLRVVAHYLLSLCVFHLLPL